MVIFNAHKTSRGILIELSLVLTGSFRLLLTLQAGADVMLALLNFSDNALLGAAPLKTAQGAFQRFVFLYANFRHCFPSLRWHPASSWMRSGPYRLVYYMLLFPYCQDAFSPFLTHLIAFHHIAGVRRKFMQRTLIHYFTIKLTSLFLTTIVLIILPPFFSRNRAIFSSASTFLITVSLSRSASMTTVPRILPLT